jgi:hypothetical protein
MESNNNIIETYQKGDFKIEFRSCLTTKGKLQYGGYVYYLDKFIKFIPFTDRKVLTEKYIKNLVDKHIINNDGIFIQCKDNNLHIYHYFNENMVYPY